jgi:hypothetical protein
MIPIIDRWIEKKLKLHFHKKRDKIIGKAFAEFCKTHDQTQSQSLLEKLNHEADRMYAVIDRSILRARINRSKWVFWSTLIASIIIVGTLGAFTAGLALPFISPALAALVTWSASIGTIPIDYLQRLKGAMDSELIKEDNRQQQLSSTAMIDALLTVDDRVQPVSNTCETSNHPSAPDLITPDRLAHASELDDDEPQHVNWHYDYS